jgi:hypothetical protein
MTDNSLYYLTIFIPAFPTFIRWKLDPEQPCQYHIDTSIELQTDYLIDLEVNFSMGFIGKYENLQDDYEEAYRRIGIKPPALPHHRHAKDRTEYQDYYDDDLVELV